jgi:hypothetical protein
MKVKRGQSFYSDPVYYRLFDPVYCTDGLSMQIQQIACMTAAGFV